MKHVTWNTVALTFLLISCTKQPETPAHQTGDKLTDLSASTNTKVPDYPCSGARPSIGPGGLSEHITLELETSGEVKSNKNEALTGRMFRGAVLHVTAPEIENELVITPNVVCAISEDGKAHTAKFYQPISTSNARFFEKYSVLRQQDGSITISTEKSSRLYFLYRQLDSGKLARLPESISDQ